MLPSRSGQSPLWTQQLQTDFLYPRSVVTFRIVPELLQGTIIAQGKDLYLFLAPCLHPCFHPLIRKGWGYLRDKIMQGTIVHLCCPTVPCCAVPCHPSANQEVQGRMWGAKLISCVASARPAAPMKYNPAMTSQLKTSLKCIIPCDFHPSLSKRD